MSYTELNLKDLLDDLTVDENKIPCKGQVYRYHESAFPTGRGYGFNRRLVLLKRRSCLGCDECYMTTDDINQGLADIGMDFFEFSPQLKDGDLVEIRIVPGYRDWETGYIEEWHYEVIKVQDPTDQPTGQAK